MKTRHCDTCAHWDHTPSEWTAHCCTKGHRPRFYKPTTLSPYCDNWGFKRRCEDYKEDDLAALDDALGTSCEQIRKAQQQ